MYPHSLFPKAAVVSLGLVFSILVTACGGGSAAVPTVNAVNNPTTPNPAPVVLSPPAAPTATLSAGSAIIASGQSTLLSWHTQNATTVSLNGVSVSATGALSVSPTQTTTYTLVATGAGGTLQVFTTVTVTPALPTGIVKVNHIVYLIQENRSFDNYFGQLGAYKAAQGLGLAGDVDGLPAAASNLAGNGTAIAAFHLKTSCIENGDPDWLESHGAFNLEDPTSNVFLGNGYVHNAQGQAKFDGFVAEVPNSTGSAAITVPASTTNYYLFAAFATSTPGVYSNVPLAVATLTVTGDTVTGTPSAPPITPPAGVVLAVTPTTAAPGDPATITWNVPGAAATMVNSRYDQMGRRAMGYYDDTDLPYYYALAANFATSDRWFSPIPSGSIPNRVYAYAATTHGHVHDPGILDSTVVPNIFQMLENAGVSWKVYYSLDATGAPETVLTRFQPFADLHLDHLVPVSQYFTDLQNGTLPAVALIEQAPHLDEHPGGTLPGNISAGTSIQAGAQYVSTLINAFLNSQFWNDGVFILTFDESGGLYDHVAGQPTISPDGVAPVDFLPKDFFKGLPLGDFDRTGFRVPLLVVSKFAKKGYVSHNVADYTAILRFVETRFLGPAVHLTARDAAQMDMTEFFSFDAPPWTTPPVLPAQPQDLPCNYTLLQ